MRHEEEVRAAVAALEVTSAPSEVCIVTADGEELDCYSSKPQATEAQAGITVEPENPDAERVGDPVGRAERVRGTRPAGRQLLPDRRRRRAAAVLRHEARGGRGARRPDGRRSRPGVLRGPHGTRARTEPVGRPRRRRRRRPRARPPPPSRRVRRPSPRSTSPTRTGSRATSAPRPRPTTRSRDRGPRHHESVLRRELAGRGARLLPDPDDAEEQRRETGQQRLLDVIGTTARLEQRESLEVIPPGSPAYDSTVVDVRDPGGTGDPAVPPEPSTTRRSCTSTPRPGRRSASAP